MRARSSSYSTSSASIGTSSSIRIRSGSDGHGTLLAADAALARARTSPTAIRWHVEVSHNVSVSQAFPTVARITPVDYRDLSHSLPVAHPHSIGSVYHLPQQHSAHPGARHADRPVDQQWSQAEASASRARDRARLPRHPRPRAAAGRPDRGPQGRLLGAHAGAQTGLAGKIADTLNEIVELNRETWPRARAGEPGGRQGRPDHPAGPASRAPAGRGPPRSTR